MTAAPEAAAVARFRADLERTLGHSLAPGESIALAVSGGADSMALLALAHAALPGRVIAATVDHGLRPEAAAEAAMVARWCASAGVPHVILRVTMPLGPSAIQAEARAARYALLRDWARDAGATALATAHHADDQAETFLMRANRGTGPAGLAGVRARRDLDGLLLIRPLLGWSRAELRALAEGAGLPFVDDPSNGDARFERVRMRALLAAAEGLDPRQLAASALHAAEADAALSSWTDQLWDGRSRAAKEGELKLDLADLPREMRRRLLRRAIGHLRGIHSMDSPPWSDSANVESLLEALEAGHGASLAGIMVTPGKAWRFRKAPPRRSH